MGTSPHQRASRSFSSKALSNFEFLGLGLTPFKLAGADWCGAPWACRMCQRMFLFTGSRALFCLQKVRWFHIMMALVDADDFFAKLPPVLVVTLKTEGL